MSEPIQSSQSQHKKIKKEKVSFLNAIVAKEIKTKVMGIGCALIANTMFVRSADLN